MTLEQCQAILEEICRRQGTERPSIQIVAGASIFRGRVAQSPRVAAARRNPNSPYGILVLEHLGLARGPASFVQIANIPEDGLSGIEP